MAFVLCIREAQIVLQRTNSIAWNLRMATGLGVTEIGNSPLVYSVVD